MLKKILKYLLIFLLVIASIYGIGRLSVVLYGSYSFVERQPYLQKATQNSINLLWQTPEKEKGCVIYGPKKQKLCESESSKYHKLTIHNLDPGTKYTYEVLSISLKIDNNLRHFTTLDSNLNSTQYIWVLGDSGKATTAQSEVRDAMLTYLGNKEINTWLMLGDNAYRSGTQKDFNKGLFEPYKKVLKTKVLWPVIGNHDARRWAFYDIFDFPTQGESGGVASNSEAYYSFEQGNVHFIMLDSQTQDRDKDGNMALWLEKDLSLNKKLWTIVAFHHPPYTKGSHDSDSYYDSRGRMVTMRENILPILEKYDVDLVLSGHSHVYERSLLSHKHYGYSNTFDKNKHVVQDDLHHYTKCINKIPFSGTIYNVAGSSSEIQEGINPFNIKHPMMPFSFFSSGSLLITVDEKSLLVEMVMRNKEVLDNYTITKSKSFCQ